MFWNTKGATFPFHSVVPSILWRSRTGHGISILCLAGGWQLSHTPSPRGAEWIDHSFHPSGYTIVKPLQPGHPFSLCRQEGRPLFEGLTLADLSACVVCIFLGVFGKFGVLLEPKACQAPLPTPAPQLHFPRAGLNKWLPVERKCTFPVASSS